MSDIGKEKLINIRTNTKELKEARSNGTYVYIGRPSKYGNPYTHLSLDETHAMEQVKTREEAISKFREYIEEMPEEYRIELIMGLKGKVLGCFCAPLSCHGDVWIELLEEYKKKGLI